MSPLQGAIARHAAAPPRVLSPLGHPHCTCAVTHSLDLPDLNLLVAARQLAHRAPSRDVPWHHLQQPTTSRQPVQSLGRSRTLIAPCEVQLRDSNNLEALQPSQQA